MTAPTIRIHRDGYVTADGIAIGHVRRGWSAVTLDGHRIAITRTRREAVSALLDHTYGKDRWT